MLKEIIVSKPKLCECGRLYKDRKDASGKMICSACICDCSVEDLKNLWSTPEQTLSK